MLVAERLARGNEPSGVLGWLSRPVDLTDSGAYAVNICSGSMLPAYGPDMICDRVT